MAKKLLHAAINPFATILGIGKSHAAAATVDPAAIIKNETPISPGQTQQPRRRALAPLGQSQTGSTILSDTLGG